MSTEPASTGSQRDLFDESLAAVPKDFWVRLMSHISFVVTHKVHGELAITLYVREGTFKDWRISLEENGRPALKKVVDNSVE